MIPGNASLASTIKEIADIGRVGSANNIQINKSVVLPADSKKRKLDGTIITGAWNSLKKLVPGDKGNKKVPTITTTKTVVEEGKPEVDDEEQEENSNNHDETIRVLREHLESLENENRELRMEQVNKETDIRIQVSEEMAESSKDLLYQIQMLQDQLNEKEFLVSDVTKSCKKARKNHVRTANRDTEKDLLEAEEELERVKSMYENEINQLKAEKKRFEDEVISLKHQLLHSSKTEIQPIAHDPKAVASKFSQRMQRDSRFSKKEEPSLLRSPLGPLCSDGNSPIRLAALNMDKPFAYKNGPRKSPMSNYISSPKNVPQLKKARQDYSEIDENSSLQREPSLIKKLRSGIRV
jgi:hypothetical protein